MDLSKKVLKILSKKLSCTPQELSNLQINWKDKNNYYGVFVDTPDGRMGFVINMEKSQIITMHMVV